MEDLNVLLQYNGIWDESGNFKNYCVSGMTIENSCNYSSLVGKLCANLRINASETISIKFQVQENFPAISIDNYINLEFYKKVKLKEQDFMKFPLCITTHKAQQPKQNKSAKRKATYISSTDDDNGSNGSNGETSQTNANDEHEQDLEKCDVSDKCPISYLEELMEYTTDIAQDTCGHISVVGTKIQEVEGPSYKYHDMSTFQNFEMDPEINIGDVFKDKEVFKYFLAHHTLSKHFNYKVSKSNKKNYWLNCINEDCEWSLRASSIANTDAFKVRKFNNTHTCSLQNRFQEHRQLSSKFIATMVGCNLKNTKTKYGPLNIQEDVHQKYGVDIKYQQAWRSKEKASEQILGNPAKSYGDIPSYLHLLEKANPGTYTRLETLDNRSFLFAFIALSGCIEGWKHCRPQIVVDGAFLKESYGGTLITACTYNAAGNIMPLAFGVVDSENNKSWEWFFHSFRIAFGYRDNMCIISDRHESIRNASRKIYPEAGHYFCIYHILNNLKSHFKKNGDDLRSMFFGAAKAYTEQAHQYFVKQLKKLDPRVVTYLEKELQKEDWVAIYAKENRRQAMTSNIAESCNARNNMARGMPITALLEQLRALIQEWSHKFKMIARNTTSTLTEKYEEQLIKNMIESKALKIRPVSENIYNLIEGNQNFIVNMEQQTCTCREFQEEELPCRHACKVINSNYDDPYKYFSHYYRNDTLKAAYKPDILPIASQDWEDIPASIKERIVMTPMARKKPGRLKKTRFKSPVERKAKSIRCANCKGKNHNKRTCKNVPAK